MSVADEHGVVIERRSRSHRARCDCGWQGHAWNELRPAEADAWHHVYGDSRVVDVSPGTSSSLTAPPDPGGRRKGLSIERLVDKARFLADCPSPYGKQAVIELWHSAGEDSVAVQAAITEVGELLSRHSRRSASTADSEWLQLITAKRLLQETLQLEDSPSYRRG